MAPVNKTTNPAAQLVSHQYPKKPQSTPQSLVILLHGYGANGQDLIGLAPAWADSLPDTVFLSPDAHQQCDANPYGGRQWFAVNSFSQEELDQGVLSAAPVVAAYIEAQATAYKIPLSRIALVGFSQGTMMALHVGLRLAQPLAGIIGYSGLLPCANRQQEWRSKPPMLLIHGAEDTVIPALASRAAEKMLQQHGITVTLTIEAGLPHSISPAGIRQGETFLKNALHHSAGYPA